MHEAVPDVPRTNEREEPLPADATSRHGEAAMRTTSTVLLYAPRPRDDADYQAALEEAGYRVVRSTTVSGCVAHLGRADAVVLDDPPWELIRSLIATLDTAPLPLPRVWVSSWSMAPSVAGKLGIEALLLERDVRAVVEEVTRTIAQPPPIAAEAPAVRAPIRRATTTPELHPRAVAVRLDDEPVARAQELAVAPHAPRLRRPFDSGLADARPTLRANGGDAAGRRTGSRGGPSTPGSLTLALRSGRTGETRRPFDSGLADSRPTLRANGGDAAGRRTGRRGGPSTPGSLTLALRSGRTGETRRAVERGVAAALRLRAR